MEIWKMLHILGIILWIGGLMNLTRMVAFHVGEEPEVQKRLHFIENRIFKFVALPGMLLALISGLYMLSIDMSFYMKQPWMHAKLLFVGFMLGITAILQGKLGQLATNHEKQSAKSFKIAHGVTGLMLILILIMIFLKPLAKVVT